MKIGIDCRPLENDKLTGIGFYLFQNLLCFTKMSSEDEFYLFGTKTLKALSFELPHNFHIVIIPGKIGTTWVRYKLAQYINKMKLDVFWGTEHILPKEKNIHTTYVLTVHDIALMLYPRFGSFKNALMQNIYAKKSIVEADLILAISESTKHDLHRHLNIPDNKITVTHLAGNIINDGLSKNQQASAFKFDFVNNKYLLFLGTIEPRKNIINLLKAFDIFCNKHPEYYLVLAGGLGWKYKKIFKTYGKLKFKKNVIFLGYISSLEKKQLLENCSCFVFPSFYEGFGLPVLEAMYYGKPILTSNVSSLPEIGGDLAFYCSPSNVSDMASQMEKIILLDELTIQNIEISEKERFSQFSWDTCSRKTLESLKGFRK